MSEADGRHLNSGIDELEEMKKLLLRAQLLQQDALETLQKTVASHAKAVEDHNSGGKNKKNAMKCSISASPSSSAPSARLISDKAP